VGALEDPCLSEAIRQQLERLMADKARLAEDNSRWAGLMGDQAVFRFRVCVCAVLISRTHQHHPLHREWVIKSLLGTARKMTGAS